MHVIPAERDLEEDQVGYELASASLLWTGCVRVFFEEAEVKGREEG